MNKLYYGDCLTIMRDMPIRSVDLIYLDPPFNSNRAYNAIYKDETGNPLPDQIEAFCDQWTLDKARQRAIKDMPVLMREAGIEDDIVRFWQTWMNALRDTQPNLLAYLSYMVERLIWMRMVLKDNGTIYLHCDPTASHYIKVMMDGIFGHKNFRNEIAWCYRGAGYPKNDFGKKHDIILRYSKTGSYSFNVDDVRMPYAQATIDRFKHRIGNVRDGVDYGQQTLNPKGRHPDDWWEIQPIAPSAKERMGYATQKPLALMDRIIKASSSKDDVVFDPFCGCATTLEAAHRLGRRWIGIDIAIHAVKRVGKVRLEERLGLVEGRDFIIEGVPRNYEGAKDLWERDKYQFQKWAVEQVDGFVTTKRTADGGIDGRIYFEVPEERELQSMVLEVKGGKNVNINDIRALGDVLEHSDAWMAGLILLQPLGKRKAMNFAARMAQAGDVEINGALYPRMQLLTVDEIFDNRSFDTPAARGKRESRQLGLQMDETQN